MERRTFKEWPPVLRRRWLLAGAAGCGFLLVGLVMYFSLDDRTLLMLSTLLAVLTALRCLSLYRTVCNGAYEVVEGVCIEMGRAGLRKQREIRLLQHDGNEYAFLLGKRAKPRIANCYRVYVQQDSGGELFPDLLVGGRFLGLEDLGHFGKHG